MKVGKCLYELQPEKKTKNSTTFEPPILSVLSGENGRHVNMVY